MASHFSSVDDLAIQQGKATLHAIDNILANSCTTQLSDTLEQIIQTIIHAATHVHSRNVMTAIFQHALEGPLEQEPDEVALQLSSRADLPVLNPVTAYVVYGLLHQLGNLCPNTFKKLDDDLLQKLKEFLLGDPGLEPRSPEMAAKLMCKMLHSRELSLADLELLDADFLERLLQLIEATGTSEEGNYTLINVLLAVQSQYALKFAARLVLGNPVLDLLRKRINNSKNLSENFVFMFNRAEDREQRLQMLQFLDSVLSNEATQNLWYTNDLGVILDVVIREARNVDAEDESLHQSYILLLPLLMRHPAATWSVQKRQDVEKLLGDIRDGPFVKPSTRLCAERALLGKTRPSSGNKRAQYR